MHSDSRKRPHTTKQLSWWSQTRSWWKNTWSIKHPEKKVEGRGKQSSSSVKGEAEEAGDHTHFYRLSFYFLGLSGNLQWEVSLSVPHKDTSAEVIPPWASGTFLCNFEHSSAKDTFSNCVLFLLLEIQQLLAEAVSTKIRRKGPQFTSAGQYLDQKHVHTGSSSFWSSLLSYFNE